MSIITVLVASMGIVISAVSSIYVYNRIGFGVFSKSIYFSKDLNHRELTSLLSLVILIVFIGVFPFLVIEVVKGTLLFQEGEYLSQ